MTGKMQQEIFNNISKIEWQCLSDIYYTSGFNGIKPEAKLLGVYASHLIFRIKEFNKQLAIDRQKVSELDILKDLSFTERLQLALNYQQNCAEFQN